MPAIEETARSTRHVRIAATDAEKMACISFSTGITAAEIFRELAGDALDAKYAALPADIRRLHKGRGRIRNRKSKV